jgi:hypothetical protein
VTVPDGGFANVITIDESPIWTLTGVLIVCCGVDESVAVTETEYVPAVAGIPDNCPALLSARPGGSGPDSVQLSGGVPPDAKNR